RDASSLIQDDRRDADFPIQGEGIRAGYFFNTGELIRNGLF
ncbi:19871_t:CDS:1, partial [Funneliformis geosporum]